MVDIIAPFKRAEQILHDDYGLLHRVYYEPISHLFDDFCIHEISFGYSEHYRLSYCLFILVYFSVINK